ncbi:MAG TPA: hypothetical protein VFP40_12750, partial [Terriglobales bacterium]|nr:hypothetical protein [Terriglobales bacterium]
MRQLVLITLLLAATAALGQSKAMSTDTTQRDPKFAQLAERYMYESLVMSPVSASYAGYHKHTDPKTGKVVELDALLDDVSAKAYQEQIAFFRNWQKRLKTEVNADKLNLQDKADWRLIDDNISLSLHAGDVLGLIGPNGA